MSDRAPRKGVFRAKISKVRGTNKGSSYVRYFKTEEDMKMTLDRYSQRDSKLADKVKEGMQNTKAPE